MKVANKKDSLSVWDLKEIERMHRELRKTPLDIRLRAMPLIRVALKEPQAALSACPRLSSERVLSDAGAKIFLAYLDQLEACNDA